MLRLLALVLLLANGMYYAWGNGYLLPLGLGPVQQREPQRLAQQIEPDSVKLISPQEFKRIEEQVKADREPKECLQAGPFDDAQSTLLRQALGDALPAGSWQLDEERVAARWIIYMGKYAGAEALAKKRSEVVAMGLKTESLENAALEPGFSLGGFETKADADAALARLSARGLHTARVVQEREALHDYQLKLPSVNAAFKAKLADLRGPLAGKSLHACN
jgi:hypothetical protein